MSLRPEEEAEVLRYLLDDREALSEEDRVRLEERCFTDDEFFLSAEVLEEELIRHYVQGELAPGDRLHFEKKYLGPPALSEKVEFTRALLDVAGRGSSERGSGRRAGLWARLRRLVGWHHPDFRFAVAGVALAGLVGSLWLGVQHSHMRRALAELRAENTALQKISGQRSEARTAVPRFVLNPELTRSAEDDIRRLLVPRGSTEILLHLDCDDQAEADAFLGVLTTVEGLEVWSGGAAGVEETTRGRAVLVRLPVGPLATGDYILSLRRLSATDTYDTIETYSFGIVKQ